MRASVKSGTPVELRTPARRRWRPRRFLPLRLAVLLRRDSLDHALAAGAGADSSEELALRAAQLVGERSRRALADGLARLLAPPRGAASMSSSIRPRASVARSRTVLLALQRRLRSEERLAPQGVAILRWLITEPASPLYAAGEPEALSSILRLAAATMTAEAPEP